jgi:hypothetical protein
MSRSTDNAALKIMTYEKRTSSWWTNAGRSRNVSTCNFEQRTFTFCTLRAMFDVGYFPPNTPPPIEWAPGKRGPARRVWRHAVPQVSGVANPSADVCDAAFGLQFRRILAPFWQLKHHRLLTFFETGQKRQLSIRELQRVVMRRRALFVDLPENRSSVI